MTSDVRPHRTTAGPPLFLLPALFLVVLFGIAVAAAQIAPSRVTTGIYQVVVWEGADNVVIPTESLSCERTGDTAACTAPVGRHRLTVELGYTGVVEPGACTARYDGRPVSCARQMGFYGHASHTVWVRGLGLSGAQQAELRADIPWWRVESDLTSVGLALVVALGVGTGLSTFLARRRARPAPPGPRLPVVIGSAGLGLGLFFATSAVIGPVAGGTMAALSPFSVLAAAAVAAWQWELSGPPLGGRAGSAVIAGGAATFYSGIALIIVAMQSGFVD
jgi:hypothetical protein